ncbi:NCS1 nucleoside transporter [Colletotrichum lupini]|uniref:NCS1 nucleoside transporter n=1 Tax=Colletotrichum lupini TaxID=145971 RepID=A0A9Q8SHJ2_9PEZI|nr:NCS1 nucleoside transporter [Colletotrichum lupini]UQC77494.1 NCS1 nucleoside transporter [Colletotrichum lupini]
MTSLYPSVASFPSNLQSSGVFGVMGGRRIFRYWRLGDGLFLDLLKTERLAKQSTIAIVVAHTFVGFVCIAGGHPGAKWHIGFPLWMKQDGVYGAIRVFCIDSHQHVVWKPTLEGHINLHLAIAPQLHSELADGTMKVYDLISFILKPSQAVLLRLDHGGDSRFVLLIWWTARAGGGGAILADVSKVSGIKPAQWGDLGWAVSDYTRYARKPGDQVLAQLIMEPLETIIQPYAFLEAVRKNEANFGARAGAVRGYRSSRVATAICGNFLIVAGSFNVFLGPIKGIMFADDFLIRKRTMKLTGL